MSARKFDDLDAARSAASGLTHDVAVLRELVPTLAELKGEARRVRGLAIASHREVMDWRAAHKAIHAVAVELRQWRARTGRGVARLGGFIAATAHEVSLEMLKEMNHPTDRAWPDVQEVRAEIDLEHAGAKERRAGELGGRIASALTRRQLATWTHLAEKKTATFDVLRNVPGAFAEGVTDTAIERQLKRIKQELESDADLIRQVEKVHGHMTISPAKRRVSLN